MKPADAQHKEALRRHNASGDDPHCQSQTHTRCPNVTVLYIVVNPLPKHTWTHVCTLYYMSMMIINIMLSIQP